MVNAHDDEPPTKLFLSNVTRAHPSEASLEALACGHIHAPTLRPLW